MLFTLFFQQDLKLGLKLPFKNWEKESALTLSKTMKLPIYSAVKCYQVLPSAIKCFQALKSAIKCSVWKEKQKQYIFLIWKEQVYLRIRNSKEKLKFK